MLFHPRRQLPIPLVGFKVESAVTFDLLRAAILGAATLVGTIVLLGVGVK